MHIIIYKYDGADLHLSTRHIGPFVDFNSAYNYLPQLKPPINGGHKFIEELENPAWPAE